MSEEMLRVIELDAQWGTAGPAVPRVRQGKARVNGTVDKALIRGIVRAHLNAVRYCYDQGLIRKPKLAGRVVVEFSIASSTGKVRAAVVVGTTLGDARVETCIKRAVKRWRFPRSPSGGTTVVTYPFVLSPG